MKIIRNAYSVFIILFMLQGCNAIYFYETQKYSLTVEGRPDVTSPASFNLGIKHRVAAVIPEKGNMLDLSSDNSEAVSLISYFNLHKTNDPAGFFDDPMLVETALISGNAAAYLGKNEGGKDLAGEVLNIISNSNRLSGNDFVYINNVIGALINDEKQGITNAKEIMDELRVVKNELFEDSYPVNTYIIEGRSMPYNLAVNNHSNATIRHEKSILGLFKLLGELDKSMKTVQGVIEQPEDYIMLGEPVNNQNKINGLKEEIKKTEAMSNRLSKKLKNEKGFIRADNYYIKNHLG